MTDLANMGSLSSKNWNVKYSLFAIDVLTKYPWFNALTDKKKLK